MKKILLLVFLLTSNSTFAAVINSIKVYGNLRMDKESIAILADVKNGDNINSYELNNIVKKLQESGYFLNVSADINGNTLNISVSEAPIVSKVTIEGNDEISRDDLKKEIQLKDLSVYSESVIGMDIKRMLTLYQRKGFFGTKIEPQKITLDDNRVNIVYSIKEGHPTYIEYINFEGNKKFSSSSLRGAILSRQHRWWRVFSSFDVFDEDRIKYDQSLLGQFYLRHGYADFTIKEAKGEFTENREYYSVKFTVDEGNKYYFGKVSIKNPFDDVKDEDILKVIKTKEGNTYNTDKVETTISNIRLIISDNGYSFINVEPKIKKNSENRTIDIEYDIEKTKRMYLSSIDIKGNVRTFDSVIKHMLPMRESDPFSLQTIENGRQRLMRSRFFKDVQMVPLRIENEDLINLELRVSEQPTGELSGGVGWSNINGFMIDAGITENNFMGRGQIVQLKASIAEYQKNVGFSFTEPYLFDRDLSGGFDVSYTRYDYGTFKGLSYDKDALNISGRLGWLLTDNWSQTLRLSATFDKNFDRDSYGKNESLYTLSTNFRYYNLDTNFAQNTHTGITSNIFFSYTGFGGTQNFLKFGSDITGLVNFFDDRWQLKSSLDFGYMQEIGRYIPRVYRFFLGGETLRGFDVAGVGSRNPYYNVNLGGLWKLNGTTQLNFPIFIPDEYQVKGFIFTDYGILGRPPKKDYKFGSSPNFIDQDLRTSVGFGIFWNTPMGPMNFSWGWPIRINPYDIERKFLLSFATQF